jgi:biopolymer transport protein ExbD
MRTLLASCLMAGACAVLGVPVTAGDESASVTVALRAGPATRYAEVVTIVAALREAQVRGIRLEIAGQQGPRVSAVIRARSDAPYSAVREALEALQGAGIRNATLDRAP